MKFKKNILIIISMFFLFLFLPLFFSQSDSLDIFVTNNVSSSCSFPFEAHCGSFNSPFPTILSALFYIDFFSEEINKRFSEINILLCSKVFIVDSFNVTFFLNELNSHRGEQQYFWKVFSKLQNGIHILIKPESKKDEVLFSFRTLKMGFFLLNANLWLERIVFDFKNIDFELIYQIDCLYWEVSCCGFEERDKSHPCFNNPSNSYNPTESVNFIEIYNIPGINFNFIQCEINNLHLPKKYENFYVKGVFYDNNVYVVFNVMASKFENISVEHYFFGSIKYEYELSRSMKQFYWVGNIMKNIWSTGEGSVFMILYYYEVTISHLITEECERLFFFQSLIQGYITDSFFFSKTENKLQENLFGGTYEKLFFSEVFFIGAFLNTYILNLVGNTYLNRVFFKNLQVNNISPLVFDRAYTFQMIEVFIEIEKSFVKDQLVIKITNSYSMYFGNLTVRNHGEYSLTVLSLISSYYTTPITLTHFFFNDYPNKNDLLKPLRLKFIRTIMDIIQGVFVKTYFIFEGKNEVYCIFSTFSNNNSIDSSTFYFESNNAIFFYKCEFTKISGLVGGSAFYLGSSNFLSIFKSIFSSLENLEGGAILCGISLNHIKFQDLRIEHIYSQEKGGAILLLQNNFLSVNKCNGKNITTLSSGGFLFTIQSQNFIQILNSNFSGIYSGKGAFIFLNYNCFLFLWGTTIDSSFAMNSGGTFVFQTLNVVYIIDSSFEKTGSKELGGFMSVADFNKLLLFSTNVTYSESDIGVNIYFRAQNIIFCYNVIFSNMNSPLSEFNKKNIVILREIHIFKIEGQLFSLKNENSLIIDTAKFQRDNSTKEFLFCELANYIIFMKFTLKERMFRKNVLFNVIGKNYINFKNGDIDLHLEGSAFSFLSEANVLIEHITIKVNTSIDFLIKSFDSNVVIVNSKILCFSLVLLRHSSFIMKNCTLRRTSSRKDFLDYALIITSRMLIINSILKSSSLNKTNYKLNFKFSSIIFVKIQFTNYHIVLNDSKIRILDSHFNGRSGKGFNFTLENANYAYLFSIKIVNSIFLFHKNGVISFLSHLLIFERSLVLIGNIFKFNKALQGAALSANNLLSAILIRNNFEFNEATKFATNYLSKGGVLYFDSSFSSFNFSLHIYIRNNFLRNKADAGGVFFFNSGFPFISLRSLQMKNKFLNNLALFYGDDMTSCTVSLNVMKADEFDVDLRDLVSGKTYSSCLAVVKSYDFYKQNTANNDEDYFRMLSGVAKNGVLLNLTINWSLKNGQLCFGNFLKNSYLGDEIFWNNITFNYLNKTSSSVHLSYNFRKCVRGEKMTDDFQCAECLRNFYSFTSNINSFSNCLICKKELGFFCFGGSKITIKTGFWRKNKNSTNIIKCINEQVCIGDEREFDDNIEYLEEYVVSKCAEGYINPLCGVCKKGWARNTGYTCSECGDYRVILKTISLAFIQFFFLFYTIKQSFRISKGLYTGSIRLENLISLELLKMFSFHAQLLIVIFSLRGNIINFRSIFELNPFNSNISDSLNLQCLLNLANINISYYYSKLIVSLNTPLFLLLISAAFLKIIDKKKGDDFIVIKKVGFFFTLKTLFMVSISLQMPNIIRDCIDGLIYINIADSDDTPDFRVLIDVEISYSSIYFQTLRYFLIIPIIIVGISFPFFLFFRNKMIKMKKKNSKAHLFLYGYFFYSYKKDKFFWDLMISFKKLIILVIISFSKEFVIEGEVLGFCIIPFVLIIIYHILNKIKPYKKKFMIIHQTEEASLISLILSILITLPTVTYKIKNESDYFWDEFSFYVVYMINGFFYLSILYVYYKHTNLKDRFLRLISVKLQKSKSFKAVYEQINSFIVNSTSQKKISGSLSKEKNEENVEKKEQEERLNDPIIEKKIKKSELFNYVKAKNQKFQRFSLKFIKMQFHALREKEKNDLIEEPNQLYKAQTMCFEQGIQGTIYEDVKFVASLRYKQKNDFVFYNIRFKSRIGKIKFISSKLVWNNKGIKRKTQN